VPQNDLASIDPNEIAHLIEEAGTAWAHAVHAADLLEKTTRPVLSEITNNIRKAEPDLSRREAEDLAQATPQYLEHIYAALDARREANIARAKLDAAKAKFEAMRSAQASHRASIQAWRG
jgi:hypothetical protein